MREHRVERHQGRLRTCILLVGSKPPKAAQFNIEVRHFGTVRTAGNGEQRRLRDVIQAGGIDAVILQVRSMGHSLSGMIRRLCRTKNIPLVTVAGGRSSVRRALETIAVAASIWEVAHAV